MADELKNSDETLGASVSEAPKNYLSWAPKVMRAVGIIVLVLTIAILLPISVPKVLGMQTYNITSGSMEPEIPVDSLVAVEYVFPPKLNSDDVIAFHSSGGVVVHRIVKNNKSSEEFITKGDANPTQDINPVSYGSVIGKVAFSIPLLGAVSSYLSTLAGKFFIVCLIISGALFVVLAGQLDAKRRYLENAVSQ